MNDPKVVALIYRVEHGKSVHYENAAPLRFENLSEFDLTVEDNIVRFEFKKFYATEAEAREAIEPFIQQWEFESGIRWGPNSFSLCYMKPVIIDQNLSPSEPGVRKLRASHVLSGVSMSARVTLGRANYPSPPAGGSVDLEDVCVVKMESRYDQYCLGRAKLPEVAYFCVDALEEKYDGISAAAKACGISRSVLEEIKKLSSYKGGEDSRKAEGFGDDFTREEKRFLKAALKEVIIRAARVAADNSQRVPKITKEDLPKL